MSTLKLDSNNDLYFVNNKLTLITGLNTDDEILQRIKVRLRFFKDEWYLNSDHGIPYLQDILGTKNLDLNILETICREALLDIEGVKEILESSIDYNKNDRKIIYTVKITSINNTVIIENLVLL